MDIQTFLELCVGQWFSQRSSYQFEAQKAESHKSELTVELFSAEHTEVMAICQQYGLKPNNSMIGQKISWDNAVDWGKAKQGGTTTIIIVPDENNPQIGRILRGINAQLSSSTGNYSLGQDEALTLTLEGDNIHIEERLWFASPNLRLRSSLIKGANGYSRTAFYSEIRKLPPKDAA
ncbi:phycobiliprotein lyase [Crocosphaera sp. UHCC 0190]|uniref:phycobiliprotein lyase n=1 Tax=Crocosphaera sp. UHCC 0190 TaxID=3110246 RepID=UPI002B1FA0AF|nr:phycobiliprotein lyase [Crocosphaera sp. UHCC 0190]MEA5510321.1 phycobiliprotein lyase [Crocosphaera sp. UHCC 0190]